jgi:hypothetical protein
VQPIFVAVLLLFTMAMGVDDQQKENNKPPANQYD